MYCLLVKFSKVVHSLTDTETLKHTVNKAHVIRNYVTRKII